VDHHQWHEDVCHRPQGCEIGPLDCLRHLRFLPTDAAGCRHSRTLGQGPPIPGDSIGPDFFDGKPADISWYPPDNDDKGKKLGEFFNTQAAPPKTLERIPKVLKEIEGQRSSIKQWGVVGYCWGGKIVNLSSQKDTLFKAAASCHPAMVDANDAPGITIPFIMLPSKDEPKDDVEKWQKAVKTKNTVEWFPNQVHGFMAARGDLKDDAVKADYEKAYQMLLNFFHEHM
jgi:dienelactone hydrolase